LKVDNSTYKRKLKVFQTSYGNRKSLEVYEGVKYPVKYRLTFDRKQHYLSAGISLTPEEWVEMRKTKKADLSAKRDLLVSGFNSLMDLVEEVVSEGVFSFEMVKRRLGKGDRNDVFEAYENRISDLTREGRIGTATSYSCSHSSLRKFAGGKKLIFSDISEDWLRKYERWMVEEGNSYTTIGIYLRPLRALFNSTNTPIAQYPFGKGRYMIPKGKGTKRALHKSQILALKSEPALPGTSEDQYRDLWLFSYLCNGANIKDICNLKHSNIKGNRVVFVRSKTERTTKSKDRIEAVIVPDMKRIIDEWGSPTDEDSYIFPYFNKSMSPADKQKAVARVVKMVNKSMNRIAKRVGIDFNVTSYVARHSFAVNSERNGQRLSVISKTLGHKDLKTTIAYLNEIDSQELEENANKLL
jgi:integrase